MKPNCECFGRVLSLRSCASGCRSSDDTPMCPPQALQAHAQLHHPIFKCFCAHARTHVCMHVCTHAQRYARMYTHTQVRTHARRHTHTHIHTHTHVLLPTPTQGAILLNTSGKRFVDELSSRDRVSDAIMGWVWWQCQHPLRHRLRGGHGLGVTSLPMPTPAIDNGTRSIARTSYAQARGWVGVAAASAGRGRRVWETGHGHLRAP